MYIPKKKRKEFSFLYEPEEEVDFHGFWGGVSKEEVEAFTQERIDRLKEKGVRRARFIIGKGLHSEKEPVIPPIVKIYLYRLQKKGEIRSVSFEKTSSGINEGSLIVVL